MNIKFDILTMLYALTIGNFIWFVLYIAYFRFSKSVSADVYWLAAKLLQALAWLLLSFRDRISDFFSVFVGNSSLFIGLALECLAILMVSEKLGPKLKKVYIGFTACIIIIFFFGHDTPGTFRVVSASIGSFFMFFLLGARLYFSSKSDSYLQKTFGFLVIIISIVISIRAVVFIFGQFHYNLFTPLPIQTLAFISVYLLMFIGGVGYLLILREKIDNNLLRESLTDYLTDLPNRRAFFDQATKGLAYCRRYKLPVSILTIDLDNFKIINDKYGHEVGDEVLKYLGHFLKKEVRQYDVVARTGGEEFAFFLHNTDEAGALMIAARIKQDFHSIHSGNQTLNFTMSIGICSANLAEKSVSNLTELLRYADKALYNAKRAGRNKIMVEQFNEVKP